VKTPAPVSPAANTAASPATPSGGDFLPLQGIDHIEFWVGNAYQSAHFYRGMFGFDIVAHAGLETGVRDRAGYVLRQGNVTLALVSALGPDHEIASHCERHGDGVKSIALRVRDVEAAVREVKARGATVVQPPTAVKTDEGEFRTAAIKTFGDTIHRFVERENYQGVFAPGYRPYQTVKGRPCGLQFVDHVVGNVDLGMMNWYVDFYARVMGFHQLAHFDDKQISTEYSALMSKVMEDGKGRIKFPINEPAEGRRKSQIEEYLDFYRGPGVQHIAMLTSDIFATVRALRENGVRFLRVPDAYYERLPERLGGVTLDVAVMRELGILFDRDDEGHLLQIFTQPVEDRPTLFYEVIERHGSRGFGVGNFKALFVSIEEEQAKRGNL
jgi:4-hydroxyphenylpyruvate dioxygenase